MSKPQNAAVYVRISDDRAKDAAGVGRQEQDARALAERLGWQVGPVIVENDVSAYKRQRIALPNGRHELRVVRPGFRNLLDLIVAGAVDGMIAYDLDRTARDPRDLEDLIDAVEQRVPRLPVESVSGSLRLANDSDVTMGRVMVAIANKSSRDSSRRIKRKHDELAEQGRFAGGGARRFGFEHDGMTHNPREAEAIRWAARRVLDGQSVSSLTRELDERGVHPVKAAKWSAKSLTEILRGPRVAGLRVHRGEVVGKATWQPIIDLATHEALVAELHKRSKGAVQPTLVRWCNQILFCGVCDHHLSGNSAPTVGGGYRYWCDTGRGGCGKIAVNGPGAEGEVERQVIEYLTHPDVISRLAEARSTQGTQRARADIAADEQQLRELARMWAEKQITLDEYAEARKIIEKRLNDARQVTLAAVPDRVRKVLASTDHASAWDNLEPQAKREVVQVVVQSVGMKGWKVHPADTSKARAFQPERLEPLPMDN
jgi:site-specific DNA recombinase